VACYDEGVPADHVLRRLHRARDRMLVEIAEPWTVDALAREANMSSFHFLREFRRTFGAPPGRYLSKMRITRAQELLARGVSVTEACLAVGFSSLGSFSTAFSARCGMSPRAYQTGLRAFGTVPERLLSLRVPMCFASFFAGPLRESNPGEVPAGRGA
jgi:AraC-like DNA-binding protein